MAPKRPGGVRNRLGIDDASSHRVPPSAPASSSDDPVPLRRGVRRRLGLDAAPVHVASAPAAPASSSDGGRRQTVRRRLHIDSSSTGTPNSQLQGPLIDEMKSGFADGSYSAAQVERIFTASAGHGATGLPQLSSAHHPQNLQRSLVAAWGQPVGAPPMEWRMLPTSKGLVAHPFLMPHAFFGSLYIAKPDFWNRAIRGPIGAAARFWANVAQTEFVRNHPHLEGVDKSRLIALGLHGDSGKFSNNDKLYVFTWNSIFGSGTTKSTRFLMTVVKNSIIIPENLHAIAQILAWSFNVLLTGMDPLNDEHGRGIGVSNPGWLADGWKAVLCQVRGDWEFFNSIFGAPHWKCLDRMCWRCGAVGDPNSPLRYSRSDRRSPWRRTRLTHEQFLVQCALVSPWFTFVHGLRIECLMIDVLHCIDLGVFAHLVGNIFGEVVSLNIWGTTQAINCAGLEKAMKKHYSARRIKNQFRGKLTAERIKTSNGWPKLKGQGATVRSLGTFCEYLSETYLIRRHVLLCSMMVRFYELLDEQPLFLSKDVE